MPAKRGPLGLLVGLDLLVELMVILVVQVVQVGVAVLVILVTLGELDMLV